MLCNLTPLILAGCMQVAGGISSKARKLARKQKTPKMLQYKVYLHSAKCFVGSLDTAYER